MDRYSNLESVMRHNEETWPRKEMARNARCILDALRDLVMMRDLQEVTDSLEMSGILSSKEARHFKAKDLRTTIKEATGLLQSPIYLTAD